MDRINLALSAQTYATVIAALKEMPWKVAQPALQEIDPQVRAALEKSGRKDSKSSSKKSEEQK